MSGGIFFGINIGVKSLRAQQLAMNVTGHNIANANTPGYSRQVANMETGFAVPVPSNNRWRGAGQLGTGVEISEVRRIRDQFIDWQIRAESGVLEEWKARHDALNQVEVVFMEPSDTGLSSLFSDFWNSWQELSKFPESSSVRTTVKETAVALAEAFRYSYARLENIEEGLDRKMEIAVNEANSILSQVAALNEQIKYIKVGGDNPNDLMDKRDLLLDSLANLMDIEVKPVFAQVAGKTIATGEVTVSINTSDGRINLVGPDLPGGHQQLERSGLEVSVGGSLLELNAGEMYGLQKTGFSSVTDTSSINYYKNKLDVLAKGLAEILNDIHQGGLTLKKDESDNWINGGDFFVFRDAEGNLIASEDFSAKYLYVNPVIEADVGYIAAGRVESGEEFNPGNRENALLIASLRNLRLSLDSDGNLQQDAAGDLKFETFYQNFVAELGVATREAERMVENQKTLVGQLVNRKEAVAGVSIDEEVANMIRFQHAFQAAARYIRVLDELSQTIVNGLKA
ncbi:MAG: flagellar hook-associated protein FlgK [Bacillota bacterium]